MSIIDSFKAWLRPWDMNERGLNPAQVWGSGGGWRPLAGAGIEVTAEAAMQAATGACIRLLADDISSLPVDVYQKVNGETRESDRPAWLEYPTGRRWDTFQAHISDVVVSLLWDGNIFVECAPNTLNPAFFSVKDPEKWKIELVGNGLIYKGPESAALTELQMMHIPWVRLPGKLRGLSVLEASKESTGLELAAREWASAFFRNGGTLGNVVQLPESAGWPTDLQIAGMKEQFNAQHQGTQRAWLTGVLTGGATIHDGSLKPQEAALEPLWKHVLEEAARLYHIPPHLLGSQDPGGSSYSSVEHRSIEYVQHAVVPITSRLEAAYSRFLGQGEYVKFNVNALLRGDVKSRAEAEAVWLQNRVIRIEEVRALEDFPRDAEAEGYLDTPNNRTRDPRFEDVGALIRAGFDPAASLVAVGLPPIIHSGLVPVTVQGENVAETAGATFSPELRIDSVAVSEQGVDRIAAASTDGIATGIASLGGSLSDSFTESITRMAEANLAETRAELAEVKAKLDAIEEREARRSAPVSIRVDGDTVYEQRGDQVVKKRITRNESGRVIGLIAEAS